MRLIFFLLIATLGLYSCNNDLTTIGQDLINNGNHIEVQKQTPLSPPAEDTVRPLRKCSWAAMKINIVVSRRHPPVFRSFRFPNRLSISGICWIRSPSISKQGKIFGEIRQKQLLLKHFHFIVWPACRNSGQTKTTTFITGILFHGEINWQQSVLFPKG